MSENVNPYAIPKRALIFAPLASIPFVSLLGLDRYGSWFANLRDGLFVALVFGLPAFYVVLTCFGTPVYLLLVRYRIFNLWVVCALSALPPAILLLGEPWRTNFIAISACTAVGAAAFFLSPKSSAHASQAS